MADFPTTTPTFRTLENLPHVTYDAAQKKTIYAEDMTKLQQELLAVMSFAQQLRTDLNTQMAKQEYKVGDIFLSFNSTNPATVKGYGTWELVGKGQTLVGVDTAQTEFNTVKKTGGAKTHTLTQAQMPSHSHGVGYRDYGACRPTYQPDNNWATVLYNSGNTTHNTSSQAIGGNEPHNILQPYLTCYIWERTA